MSSREGIERVLESGTQLLSDHFNLLKIELRETVRTSARGSIFIALGLLTGVIGGGVLLAAYIAVLLLVLPTWAALAVAGGSCLLLGGASAIWGRTVIKRGRELRAAAQELKGIIHPLESTPPLPAIPASSVQGLDAQAEGRPLGKQQSLHG